MAAIRTFSRSECQGYQVISNSFGKNTLALVTGVRPTQDTAVLVQAALATIQAIYRPGFNYAKAGKGTPDKLATARIARIAQTATLSVFG